MDQPNDPPKRQTQPLKRPGTTPFGDRFVATGGQGAQSAARGTRPLQTPPAAALKQLVPQKLDEVRRDIDYVRHLTTLFAGPIMVLRCGLYLVDAPPPEVVPVEEPVDSFFAGAELAVEPAPEPSAEQAADEDFGNVPAPWEVGGEELTGDAPFEEVAPEPPPVEDTFPAPFRALSESQRALAWEVAEAVRADARLKQRAQVALYQFDEAVKGYEEASAHLQVLYQGTFEEAWEGIPNLHIERLKGKAYPIVGFYDNFKRDPAICKVFPAPNQRGNTAPLITPVSPTGQPILPPSPSGPLPQQPQPSAGQVQGDGLMGKLKGLFGKL